MTAVLVVVFLILLALYGFALRIAAEIRKIERDIDALLDETKGSGFGRTPVGLSPYDHPNRG